MMRHGSGGPLEATTSSAGAQRLYQTLVVLAILGAVLTSVGVLMELAASEFRLWLLVLERAPAVATLVHSVPALDLAVVLPFLDDVSWFDSDGDHIVMYARYTVANILVAILLVSFRVRLTLWLEEFVEWARQPTYRTARLMTLGTFFGLSATFLLRLHWGFIFAGISGWTYDGWSSGLQTIEAAEVSRSDVPAFLRGAVLEHHSTLLYSPGRLEAPAMYLHFRDGQILPANYELTGLVFPAQVFGPLYEEVRDSEAFVAVVRHVLERRRQGRAFALPLSVAYPNHAPYMPIDYRGYPSADELQSISFWRIRITVDATGAIHHDDAEKVLEIDT